MTEFATLYYEATQRGMRDYERGVPRQLNPYLDDKATECASRWSEGWDNSYQLDRSE